MAFCTTYDRILDNNIRHIYSGLPTDIRLRKSGFKRTLDAASRCHEQQRRPPDRFEGKFLEYNSTYDIKLPRAPAFRLVSKEDADRIVARVSRPTSSCKLKRDVCPREGRRQLKDICAECELSSMQQCVSKKEMNVITQRLMTPTIATNVRNKTRIFQNFVISDVTESCERASRPLSQRCHIRLKSPSVSAILNITNLGL